MNHTKPTAIKTLEGNPGKRPLNQNEPQPDTTPPACPYWLSGVAKAEWRRVAPELERLGLLTMVDKVALAGYCQTYARWKQAEKALKGGLTYEYTNTNGSTNTLAKPEVAISQKYLLIIKSFCIEFGLTPSSRGRMTVPGAADQDPLDKMLGTAKN